MKVRYMMGRIGVLFVFLGMSYASDARFAGMGNLSFLFPDDLHQLDLYDFADIPAGFFRTDTSTYVIVRGSGLKETWLRDSLLYYAVGEAIPQRLIDYAPLEAISAFGVIPEFSSTPLQLIYSSNQHKETYSAFGELKKPQSWRIYIDYGQLNRGYIGDSLQDRVNTPGFSCVYAKPISEFFDYGLNGDIFYGQFKSAGGDESATFVPFGGSGSVAYTNDRMSLGINAEYHYPMFNFSEAVGSNTYTESFRGHAVSPAFGSSVKIAGLTWVSALNYKWVSLAGKSGTNDMGDLEINGYTARSAALYERSFLNFVLFGQYDNKKPVYTTSSGDVWFETVYKTYNIGGGAGVLVDKITAGIESSYSHYIADDLQIQETLSSNDLSAKIGVEAGLIKNLFLRTGYNYSMIDPDLEQSTDVIKFNTITGGIGINLIQNARIDLAYNYKFGTLESDPGEKIIDHIAVLYFKYIINQTVK